MSGDRFIHAEQDLADALGIPQKKLRVLRQDELDATRDWSHVGAQVRYSEEGRAKLLGLLKADLPSPHSAPNAAASRAKNFVPVLALAPVEAPGDGGVALAAHTLAVLTRPFPGDVEMLTCVKCYRPNIRKLEAKRADGAIVLVRVRDNRNLRPGMAMKCRYGDGRIWELAQRLPRFPGKW